MKTQALQLKTMNDAEEASGSMSLLIQETEKGTCFYVGCLMRVRVRMRNQWLQLFCTIIFSTVLVASFFSTFCSNGFVKKEHFPRV